MTDQHAALRSVEWAFGLTLFALAVVVFGFCTCSSATTVLGTPAAMKEARETRPPDTAPAQEFEDWAKRQEPVSRASQETARVSVRAAALGIGLPVACLLVVVAIILRRLRSRMTQGG